MLLNLRVTRMNNYKPNMNRRKIIFMLKRYIQTKKALLAPLFLINVTIEVVLKHFEELY